LPPVGSAKTELQTLQFTVRVAWSNITCSFPQSGHLTRTKRLFGLGNNVSHSVIWLLLLFYREFFETHSLLHPCVAAGLALQPQCLLLGCFGELALKRIFLSTVSVFLSFVLAFASSQRPSLSCFIDGDRVRSLSLAPWAVGSDFFGRLHRNSLADSVYNNPHKHIYLSPASCTRQTLQQNPFIRSVTVEGVVTALLQLGWPLPVLREFLRFLLAKRRCPRA